MSDFNDGDGVKEDLVLPEYAQIADTFRRAKTALLLDLRNHVVTRISAHCGDWNHTESRELVNGLVDLLHQYWRE